jgi:hypothetical protein
MRCTAASRIACVSVTARETGGSHCPSCTSDPAAAALIADCIAGAAAADAGATATAGEVQLAPRLSSMSGSGGAAAALAPCCLAWGLERPCGRAASTLGGVSGAAGSGAAAFACSTGTGVAGASSTRAAWAGCSASVGAAAAAGGAASPSARRRPPCCAYSHCGASGQVPQAGSALVQNTWHGNGNALI